MNHRRAGKDAQVEEIALLSLVRQHGSIATAGLLKVIHTSKSDRLRVSAINMLLDLGYGRPAQASDIGDPDSPPLPEIRDDMTLEEMQAVYPQLLRIPVR